MHWIDGIIVGLYLLGTLAIGLWLARKVRNTTDLFLAGHSLPFWAIGMSLVVSDIGAMEMIAGTAGAYRYGIVQANWEWIGCVPAMIVGGLLFIPVFRRLGIYSIPEYLGRRYGPVVQGTLAVVAVVFMGAALGVFFQAAAAMIQGVWGWNRWTSIGLTAVIVAIYTAGGGLRAVVITDVIQCVVLFTGGFALAGIGLAEVGGWSGLVEGIRALGDSTSHHLDLMQPVDLRDEAGRLTGYPWPGIMLGLGFVLSPAYWLGNQAIVQRTLGAKDVWNARAGMIFGAGLKTIVPIAFVLPGLLGIVLLADRGPLDPNGVYPLLILKLLPVGLRGVLYAAFLAALMSSVDSYTNSAATVFTKDLYSRFWVRGRSESHYLSVGRLVSLAIIALGVMMVPVVDRYDTIYEAFQSYLSYFQGPTLALILGAVLWRGARPLGGILCLAGGIGTSIALHHGGADIHWLNIPWWSFLVSLTLLVIGSRLARRREVST